jgi:hypothetical protein
LCATLEGKSKWPFQLNASIGSSAAVFRWIANYRGLSPLNGEPLAREEQIARIKATLRDEMDEASVDCCVIRNLLGLLERHTAPGWRHLFIRTNWDYLLQREIQALCPTDTVQPLWFANTHVFHLNGTVEDLTNNAHRSPFLLEQDPAAERCAKVEANKAFGQMVLNRTVVIVGMSFQCQTDQSLLSALGRVQDVLPIGEARWIIVNPDRVTLADSCALLQRVLPRAEVKAVCATLGEWLDARVPELQARGAFAF